MLLRSPGPISPDTYSGHIRRRALCPNRLRNGMSQRSSSSCQSDILPTMVGPSKSRPPMSHRKTDLGIPCRSKSAKGVLGRVLINAGIGRMFALGGRTGHAGMAGITLRKYLNVRPGTTGQRYSASETKILLPRVVLGHN